MFKKNSLRQLSLPIEEMPKKKRRLPIPEKSVKPDVKLEALSQRHPQKKEKEELWLCFYFPDISLSLVSNINDKNIPQAVIEEVGTSVCIHTFNHFSSEFGVSENMTLNAAYALCPELKTFTRDKNKEILEMSRLADWLQKFTSHVHIVSVNKILLEIKGSLVYFSGLNSMISTIEQDFSKNYPFSYQISVSPTPLGSQLLAEFFGEKVIAEDKETLRPLLAQMPIDYLLNSDLKLLKRLNKTGIKIIQDLWRLPRDGLARRFGVELLKKLDKLAGNASDLRLIHQLPLKFEAFTELPMETANQEIIIRGAIGLFEKLVVFLRQHDTGIVKLKITLKHLKNTTDIVLYFRQMTRTASHLTALFSEKMERTRLTAPVIELTLIVDEILPFVAVNPMLFDDVNFSEKGHAVDLDWENTLEQLQNRLGSHAVKYLQAIDDVHPDYAWRYQSDILVTQDAGSPMRPLWLLMTTKSLSVENNLPYYFGILSLLQGPERIETGWWREGDEQIARDYYIVFNEKVGYLWIYRDLKKNGQWYLHGFFG